MNTFPTLKTGAVVQYPAQRAVEFSTMVLRFVDGSEQRFRNYRGLLHRWVIQLDLVDESELHQLREFFRVQNGIAENFVFTDPWDGTTYASCSVESDEIAEGLQDEYHGKTLLSIRENRS